MTQDNGTISVMEIKAITGQADKSTAMKPFRYRRPENLERDRALVLRRNQLSAQQPSGIKTQVGANAGDLPGSNEPEEGIDGFSRQPNTRWSRMS